MIRKQARTGWSLCAVLVGLMAVSAAPAQAEVGAQWLLAEQAPGTNLIPFLEAEVGFEKDSPVLVLHSEIVKIKVLLLCTDIKVKGNPKLKANGSTSSFKLLFTGCTNDLNGSPNADCTPKDAEEGISGTVVTKSLHALLILGASGEDLFKLLPDEGETFGVQELPPTCPIGTKVPVIGKLVFKDCENLALVHMVKRLFEAGPGTELWVISKTTEHVATLLGSVWSFLTGAHEGLKFSGDPA